MRIMLRVSRHHDAALRKAARLIKQALDVLDGELLRDDRPLRREIMSLLRQHDEWIEEDRSRADLARRVRKAQRSEAERAASDRRRGITRYSPD